MKKFWKILGLGALAVGLTPYKVEKNEETGEKSYQALLWRITSAPAGEDKKIDIGINLGEGTLTSKLMNAAERKDEPHLFSDELCVEYAGGEAVEATGAEEPEAPAEAEAPAAPEESAMPEEPAEPEEPKAE